MNADYDKIGPVITNLISNAVKYSPKGKEIEVQCTLTNNQVTVSVKDEGMGIKPQDSSGFGHRLADSVASGMGSWRFIIIQILIVAAWMIANVVGFVYHWDVYPYILLNLVFSTQAAYTAPIIMMAQNRQNERDRHHAEQDFKTNVEAKKEIEQLLEKLNSIEIDKLDKIISLLEKLQKNK